jgi:V8-like Glu-specific endopeptidase
MRMLARRCVGMAGAAVMAGTLTAALTGGPAIAATSTVSGSSPAAITRTVSKAAQDAAHSFWTQARMESATPVGQATRQGAPATTAKPPPGIPNPIHFNGVPTVGALFFTTGTQAHFCTASAVDSATLNLILTAAHCVYGTSPATNIAYVPEWHSGVSPYGSWPVQTITVAAGWKQSQSPGLDFAFLAVSPPPGTSKPLELVTGGLRLAVDAMYAHPIYVIGYNDTSARPIGCATHSFKFRPGQMEFYCNRFWDGTSGGPWILHFNKVTGSGTVFGDIGGYEQGGDFPWASYSDYYRWSILRLFQAAEAQPTG